jgi:hypothetical protein
MKAASEGAAVRRGRTVHTLALTLCTFALAVSTTPDAVSLYRGRSCHTWAHRLVDLTGPAQAAARADAATLTAKPAGGPDSSDPEEVAGKLAARSRDDALALAASQYLQASRREDGAIPSAAVDVGEWLQGRFAGCGPVDAARARSRSRQSRYFAHLVVQYANSGKKDG